MRKYLLIGVVALLVVVSGCTGDGGGSDPTATDAATPGNGAGGDGGFGDGFGGSGSMNSCPEGQSMSFADPEEGRQVSLEVEGIVTYDDREVCKAVWSTSGDDTEFARMEMYWATDGQYQKVVYLDDQGNVVTELNMTGGMAGMTPGDVSGFGDGTDDMGGMTDVPASMWCPEGQQTQRLDPSTGETTTMTIEGVVEHEGRETCKAVWEVSGDQAERKEMYYTQGGYLHVISYDAQGTVVDEFEVTGFTETPSS